MDIVLPKKFPERWEIEKVAEQVPEVKPPAVETMMLLIRTFGELGSFFRTFFGKYGLSEGRFMLLINLYKKTLLDQGGGISPADFAEITGVSRATVSGLLEGLEKDGLVVRVNRKDDRRMVDVFLTDKGQELMADLFPKHATNIRNIFAYFSEDEFDVMMKLLIKLSKAVSEMDVVK